MFRVFLALVIVAMAPMIGDVNGDCVVDQADMDEVLAHQGICAGHPEYELRLDVNGSGCISWVDALEVCHHMGDSCDHRRPAHTGPECDPVKWGTR